MSAREDRGDSLAHADTLKEHWPLPVGPAFQKILLSLWLLSESRRKLLTAAHRQAGWPTGGWDQESLVIVLWSFVTFLIVRILPVRIALFKRSHYFHKTTSVSWFLSGLCPCSHMHCTIGSGRNCGPPADAGDHSNKKFCFLCEKTIMPHDRKTSIFLIY